MNNKIIKICEFRSKKLSPTKQLEIELSKNDDMLFGHEYSIFEDTLYITSEERSLEGNKQAYEVFYMPECKDIKFKKDKILLIDISGLVIELNKDGVIL